MSDVTPLRPGFNDVRRRFSRQLKVSQLMVTGGLAGTHLGREAGKRRTGVLGRKAGDKLQSAWPSKGRVVCTHPDGSPRMQVLRRRQDDAAVPCSTETARHVPAMPRRAGQPRLGRESPHGSAGRLHRRFCWDLCAPVSSLSACQGPLMRSERRGPSGRRQSCPISEAGFFPSHCFVCKQVTSRFHNITFPGQRCPQTCHSCSIGEPLLPAKSADISDVLIHCTFLNKGERERKGAAQGQHSLLSEISSADFLK